MLVHSPNDVRACGLPIQSWCGVITSLDAQVREVLDTRSRPASEGGRGADIDVLKTRVSMDVMASAGYAQLSWPKVAAHCFYTGLPNTSVYITIPTLSSGDPYLVPDYLIHDQGRVRVRLSAMGVSSDELVLEQNQLIYGIIFPFKNCQ